MSHPSPSRWAGLRWRSRRRFRTGLFGAAACLAPLLASAQLPSTDLTAIDPPAIAAGTTTEVVLHGANLDELSALLFSDPRIQAEPVLRPESEFRKGPVLDGNKFRVTVPAEVEPGTVEVRAAGYFGLSPSRPLVVVAPGQSLVSDGAGAAHHDRETAPLLPREALARGHTDANRIDWWKIQAKKGERLLVLCRSERIDSLADTSLRVVDHRGHEIETSRDAVGRDPLVDVLVPADGDYWVGVHDALYQGGITYPYLLETTTRPWIDAVFPPAGQPGQVLEATVLGRNLPGGSPGEGLEIDGNPIETAPVRILLPAEPDPPAYSWNAPARALVPVHSFRLENSNPVGIGFASSPVIAVADDGKIDPVTPPCEIAARFDPEGDADTFRFLAKKGTTYWIEILGDRLAGRIDPYLVVEKITLQDDGSESFSKVKDGDDSGNPGGSTFPAGSRDASLSVTADQDGPYRVHVVNQFAGGGPDQAYRLAIREATPDFSVVAISERSYIDQRQAYPAASLLRKGGTCPVRLLVYRQDGFAGPITVRASGLPAGVTCPPVTLAAKENAVRLVFAAAADAAKWDGTVTLEATAKIGEQSVSRPVRGGSLVHGTGDTNTARVRTRLELGVPLSVSGSETTPAAIETTPERRFSVTLGESLEIPVKVVSRNEPKGNLVVSLVGLQGLTKPPVANIAEKDTDGKLTLKFTEQKNVFVPEAGTWNFVLRATGTTKYRRNPEAADRAEEERKLAETLAKKYTDEATAAKAAVDQARKALDEARRNLSSASPDAKPPVETAIARAEAALAGAEKSATEAEARRAEAEREKTESAKRADAAKKAAAPKDTAFATWSLPLTVEVKPAPEKK